MRLHNVMEMLKAIAIHITCSFTHVRVHQVSFEGSSVEWDMRKKAEVLRGTVPCCTSESDVFTFKLKDFLLALICSGLGWESSE